VVLVAVTVRDGASDLVGATDATLVPTTTLAASIAPVPIAESVLEPWPAGADWVAADAIVVSSPVGVARLLLFGGPVTMASTITRPIMATAAIALKIARLCCFHERGRGGGGYRYCRYCSGVGKGDGSIDCSSGSD
jgi:hypothetical protein